MAQGYYTLEEAAQLLGMTIDELKIIARKGEIRSFQDRGTWRFRVQDIEEMARQRGRGSAPELALGDAGPPKTPDPGKKSGSKLGKGGQEVFDFSLEVEDDEQTEIGREVLGGVSPSGKKKPGSSKKNILATPTPGSDSDVRLVGEEDFSLEVDSDVRMTDTPKPGRGSKLGPSSKAGQRPSKLAPSSAKLSPRPSKLGPPKKTSGLDKPAVDSGVRLVPMDSDSDVRIVPPGDSGEAAIGSQPPPSGADSDIRLEKDTGGRRPNESDEGMLTEEIVVDDLDEKLKQQERSRSKVQPQGKLRPKSALKQPPAQAQQPAISPFELTEPEADLPPSSEAEQKDDSSDFDLTPAGDSSSPLEPESDEFTLEVPDDELGAPPGPGGLKGPASGISLQNPLDAGISLEQGGDGSDEIEFELSLDAGNTPKPAPAKPESSEFELTVDGDEPKMAPDSDSEFELTLDADDAPRGGTESLSDSGSSEFELTLDAGEPGSGSDSEFELTLDVEDSGPQFTVGGSDSDSGSSEFELTLEDSGPDLPAAGRKPGRTQHEKDIFETDMDVPSLEDESGSEAVALDDADTDLESSDFDISLDQGEDSTSQVVALDEEEADQGAATVAARGRRGRAAPDLDESPFGELEPGEGGEVGVEEEPEPAVVQREATAPWGAWPVLFMLPCVVIMFVVGIMGFELVQGMNGYKQQGMVTKAISGIIPGLSK